MRGKSSSTRMWFMCSQVPKASAGYVRSYRLQSTSTMDLVSLDEARSKSTTSIYSTLQFKAERDFSSVASTRSDLSPEHWETLVSAAAALQQTKTIEAHEMNLVEAAERRHLYDKILFLVNHGEDESQIILEEATDSLTGRGVGQSLNLSKRTATFCNNEVGLVPDLFLVGASRKVLQTTFLSFPYSTPHHSINSTPWICHPYATSDRKPGIKYFSLGELQREFKGIDCSLHFEKQHVDSEGGLTNKRLLQQATDLLKWLDLRDERVVVGKHSL